MKKIKKFRKLRELSKIGIPDEYFKIIKKYLSQYTNIIKPSREDIVQAYYVMNYEFDNLTFGKLDQEHPKIIEQRRKLLNAKIRNLSLIMPGPYTTGLYL